MATPVTILDGGMGRELLSIGAPFRQPEWSALALTEGPEFVVQAHRNFIEAGAQVITTNSYAIVPFHIGEERFTAEALTLAETAGRLARKAASGGIRVAGSLPPLFGSYRPDLFDASRAAEIIDPLVAGMAPYVDLWLGETLGSIAEARAVHAAIPTGTPLWLSFTLDDHHPGQLRSGETAADALAVAADLGAQAVLFNCCQAEAITAALSIACRADHGLAVGGYANRFVSSHADDGDANDKLSSFRDDLDPMSYAEVVHEWLNLGATIIGGCCGMGPDHISELARLAKR